MLVLHGGFVGNEGLVLYQGAYTHLYVNRLGKFACPRVNDDQKIYVDDHKLNSGRPHDYWILENFF